MHDDFHVHLVETNLKTQASNMHEMSKEKVKQEIHSIFKKERYMTSSVRKFTSMRSLKDMNSTVASKDSLKLLWFHTTWHQELERNQEVVHVLMMGFIHLHCSKPTNIPTSVNTYILNLDLGNMLIERYTSLSQE